MACDHGRHGRRINDRRRWWHRKGVSGPGRRLPAMNKLHLNRDDRKAENWLLHNAEGNWCQRGWLGGTAIIYSRERNLRGGSKRRQRRDWDRHDEVSGRGPGVTTWA